MSQDQQPEPRRHGLPQGKQSLVGSGSESGALAACSLGCLALALLFGTIWATIYVIIF